jgi:hypothetical protein
MRHKTGVRLDKLLAIEWRLADAHRCEGRSSTEITPLRFCYAAPEVAHHDAHAQPFGLEFGMWRLLWALGGLPTMSLKTGNKE